MELATKLSTRDPTFAENRAAMAALVADLRAKIAAIEEGGGEAARARHASRGKLFYRLADYAVQRHPATYAAIVRPRDLGLG